MADMARVYWFFRQQLGLITREQCASCQLTEGQITHRLRSGEWNEIRPGVYALAGVRPTWEQSVLAVTLSGSRAYASHHTAARLYGMRGFVDVPDSIEVVTALGRVSRLEGVRGHRSGALYDVDLTTRGSIPTVTAGRALVDVSGRVTSRELGYVVDDALRRRLFSLEELRRCAERLGPAPGRSLKGMQRVVGDRLPGYSPGDSDLETRALRALTRAGLPPPRQQYRMVLAGRKVRIDLAYPEQRIAIELDGWDPHRFRSSFDADHARRDDLLVAEWSPLTFTSAMTDEYLVSTVGHLYRRALATFRAIAGGIVRQSRERSGGRGSAAALAGGGGEQLLGVIAGGRARGHARQHP